MPLLLVLCLLIGAVFGYIICSSMQTSKKMKSFYQMTWEDKVSAYKRAHQELDKMADNIIETKSESKKLLSQNLLDLESLKEKTQDKSYDVVQILKDKTEGS